MSTQPRCDRRLIAPGHTSHRLTPPQPKDEIFERVRPFVMNAFDGFNICCFSFGPEVRASTDANRRSTRPQPHHYACQPTIRQLETRLLFTAMTEHPSTYHQGVNRDKDTTVLEHCVECRDTRIAVSLNDIVMKSHAIGDISFSSSQTSYIHRTQSPTNVRECSSCLGIWEFVHEQCLSCSSCGSRIVVVMT